MKNVVLFEWTYEPVDFFEEQFLIEQDGYDISIEDGVVKAPVPKGIYDANPSIKNYLHELINANFLAIQVLKHIPYKLNEKSVYSVFDEMGNEKETISKLEPIKFSVIISSFDHMRHDKDGNILFDTRQERIDRHKEFSQRVSKYVSTNAVGFSITSLLFCSCE